MKQSQTEFNNVSLFLYIFLPASYLVSVFVCHVALCEVPAPLKWVRNIGEAEVHTFWPGVVLWTLDLPRTSSKHPSWPGKGRVTCGLPPHCPHMHTTARSSCQLLSPEEELPVQLPSPNLSSDYKQNKQMFPHYFKELWHTGKYPYE